MKSLSLALAAILMLASLNQGKAAMAATSGVSASVRAEISAVIAAETLAWNHGDAEAFAARALPDVVFANIVGMFSVGKPPFLAQHAHIFSTIYKGSTLSQEIQNISLVSPDVAIVDTLSILTGAKELPPGIQPIDGAVHTRLEQVMVRRLDGWWIASFHNVAVHPTALASVARSGS